jgi:hypothetical protein
MFHVKHSVVLHYNYLPFREYPGNCILNAISLAGGGSHCPYNPLKFFPAFIMQFF